jgi:hypothetical protein
MIQLYRVRHACKHTSYDWCGIQDATFSTSRAHSVAQISNGQYVEGLNSVDWDEDRRQSLENALHNSTQGIYCTDFIVRL